MILSSIKSAERALLVSKDVSISLIKSVARIEVCELINDSSR